MSDAARVAVVMGSRSDLPVLEGAVQVLEAFGLPFEMRVLSAHRSPQAAAEFARQAEGRGLQVIIAAAGGAAHLAGTLAAHTIVPVIGVPMPTDRMGGMDSLLSTVQMPSGVPVASMGLGASGAQNAALMSVQILAVSDASLRESLRRHREELCAGVQEQDRLVQSWLKDRHAQ